MKNALIVALIALFFATKSLASPACETLRSESVSTGELVINTDVPSHLRGASIIVRLKDGSESVVPAEKFKVVPRVQQVITTQVTKDTVRECKLDGEKNRLSVLVGHGRKDGLDVENNGSNVEVSNRVGLVGGIQYQRKIIGRLSVGGMVQSNKTVSGGLGVDF
jgi:hypothetical protein